MTQPAVNDAVNAFGIRVPPNWAEIDLHPATRDRSIAELVKKRISEAPELREHRTDLVRFLRNYASKAWDSGARYCSVFTEPAGDGIIPGAITVTVLPPAPSGDGLSTVDAIIDQLQHSPAVNGDGVWQSTTMTELEHAGQAVQVFGVQDIELNEDGYQLRSVIMNTFVPTGDHVLLVTGMSPAADLAEPLLELFETVTGTLTLHSLDDSQDDE